MSLVVVYEDNHLLIVDKPSGLVTQPTIDHEDSLEKLAKEYIRLKYEKKNDVFLQPIHRLDKDVSGLVIFARTSKALSRLQQMLRERQIEKTYHAKVHGKIFHPEKVVENFLLKSNYRTSIASSSDPQAKLSRLHYRLIQQNKQDAILEIDLETGRYHQIRAQLAHLGHPILGDTKYGSFISYPGGAIMLRHVRCSFIHPVKHIPLVLKAFF